MLHISNTCNYSCKYCSIFRINKQKAATNKAGRLMSYETMDTAISSCINLMNNLDQTELYVNVAGGETLLNKKNLFNIIEKYNNPNNSIRIFWNVKVIGSIRVEDDFVFFKKHNVAVRVNCDGKKDIHDKVRFDKKSNGTFDRVKKTLELIKQYDITGSIFSMILPENIDKLRDIVDIAKTYSIKTISFGLVYKENIINKEKLAEKYLDVYNYAAKNNVNVRLAGNIIKNYLNNAQDNNKFYSKHILPIKVRPNGKFFFVDYPLTRNLSLNIKNFEKIVNSKHYPTFLKSIENFYMKRCKDCYLYNFCLGECICLFQGQTLKPNGYELSCDYLKEIINLFEKNKKIS